MCSVGTHEQEKFLEFENAAKLSLLSSKKSKRKSSHSPEKLMKSPSSNNGLFTSPGGKTLASSNYNFSPEDFKNSNNAKMSD